MKSIFLNTLVVGLMLISCRETTYQKLGNGVLVHPKSASNNTPRLLKIEVITAKIIHVTATKSAAFSSDKSLMAIDRDSININFDLNKDGDNLLLSTSEINVKIDLNSGEIQYSDTNGKHILQELIGGGKSFIPVRVEGKNYYSIRQVFDSPADEAFYGLGAHQHDFMNYKGKDVDLTQHNIVDVVPFLVSSRNYGILWDNYSRTKFGDPRDYDDISALSLFSNEDKEGGLTATYKSLADSNKIYIQRQEDTIDYQFLDDLPKIPHEFPMAEGKVEWTGSLSPKISGLQKFLIYSSGYTKLWIDGKLMADTWRQVWNPWSRQIYIEMEANKKYPVKIEWIPDGGVSYFAFKYLTPVDPSEQNNLSLYSEVADEINYYFINGKNLDEVISGYRNVTGKAPIMPKWAMGLWQSRERYKTQDEILSTAKEFRKRHVPLDNIVLDWFYWPENKWGDHNFDSSRFPDPKGMIDELHHKLNAHIMISVWPKFYVGTENYNFMKEKGWLYMYNVEQGTKDWVGPGYVSTFYDAYNPDARKYFWSQINKKLFSLGIDAWWVDASEPDINSNSSIEERKKLIGPTYLGPSAKYFNPYSLVHCKGIYEGQRNTDPDKRVFILTRSAFGGQQRYAAATWSGDVACRWHDLKNQISAGLNICISGIPFWTTDIGGFSLERRYEKPTEQDLDEWRELNTRWYQFGVFCPLFRVHGQFPYREIYNVSPVNHPAYKSMLFYDELRYRLMPYLYTLAGNTYHKDYTIMRALIMDFPEDVNVRNIGDQYMFGPSLMICPVYQYKAGSRKVYLPEGNGWYEFYSGKYYQGGQTIDADAPYERIPVFVKEGSIIPVGEKIENTVEKTSCNLTLLVYTGQNSTFSLYEDENINYNYEKGSYSYTPFYFDNTSGKLYIGNREGNFTGMPSDRKINVVICSKDKSKSLNLISRPDKEVEYSGKSIEISLVK
jgi:alpha-D-xyloside xylohydrolase